MIEVDCLPFGCRERRSDRREYRHSRDNRRVWNNSTELMSVSNSSGATGGHSANLTIFSFIWNNHVCIFQSPDYYSEDDEDPQDDRSRSRSSVHQNSRRSHRRDRSRSREHDRRSDRHWDHRTNNDSRGYQDLDDPYANDEEEDDESYSYSSRREEAPNSTVMLRNLDPSVVESDVSNS